MDNTSNRLFFVIMSFGAAWLMLDLFYGAGYLRKAAKTTTAIVKGE